MRRSLSLLLLLCLLLGGCAAGTHREEADNTLYFFHNNPCESCHEDRVFSDLVHTLLPDASPAIRPYYIYDSSARAVLQELLDRYAIEGDLTYPLAVYRGHFLFGYDAISRQLPDLWKEGSNR